MAHLNDLELHALVCLRSLETGADGLDDPVDELLARRRVVRGAAGQVAVGNQFLQRIQPHTHQEKKEQNLDL